MKGFPFYARSHTRATVSFVIFSSGSDCRGGPNAFGAASFWICGTPATLNQSICTRYKSEHVDIIA
jgi:hypothetical protein